MTSNRFYIPTINEFLPLHDCTMAPSSNENLKEKKSKFRLSNPFKAPKDAKLATPAEQNGPTDGRVSNLNVPAVDSTYGSAEATPGSSTGQVPTMTEAQAAAQNAPMKTHTDGATGRTITTTTTTTSKRRRSQTRFDRLLNGVHSYNRHYNRRRTHSGSTRSRSSGTGRRCRSRKRSHSDRRRTERRRTF